MSVRTWDPEEPGRVALPDGRSVVGRGIREPGTPPDFALVALATRPPARAHPIVWLPWPDFGLPLSSNRVLAAVRQAHRRSETQRVAVLCGHGTGRTGALVAVLGVLGGVDPVDAVAWVRRTYRPRAVETPWQRRWVLRMAQRIAS